MSQKYWKRRDYERWIRKQGWSLVHAGNGDWKLVDEKGKIQVLNIIVTHPGNEIPSICIKKTKKALEDAGLE